MLREIVHGSFVALDPTGIGKRACARVIDAFDAAPDEQIVESGIGEGRIDLTVRRTESWWPEPEHPVTDLLVAPALRAVRRYERMYPILAGVRSVLTPPQVQRVPEGEGFYTWHHDHSVGRLASVILYLNDVPDGGATRFRHVPISVAPRAGSVLVMPTAWPWEHCGETPEGCDKVIVTMFVMEAEYHDGPVL